MDGMPDVTLIVEVKGYEKEQDRAKYAAAEKWVRAVNHHFQAHVTISVLALLLERIAEIRAGDTWRNVAAKLGQIKVVEYDRAGARVLQTTEVREETAALLKQLGVPLPPRFHAIERAPAT